MFQYNFLLYIAAIIALIVVNFEEKEKKLLFLIINFITFFLFISLQLILGFYAEHLVHLSYFLLTVSNYFFFINIHQIKKEELKAVWNLQFLLILLISVIVSLFEQYFMIFLIILAVYNCFITAIIAFSISRSCHRHKGCILSAISIALYSFFNLLLPFFYNYNLSLSLFVSIISNLFLFSFFGVTNYYLSRLKKIIDKDYDLAEFIIDNVTDLIFLYNIKKDNFEYVSPSSIQINGYTPEEHYQNTNILKELVHPDDIPIFEYIYEFPELCKKPFVIRWVKKDNSIIWTEQRYIHVYDQYGSLEKIEGNVKDITKEKETEFALRDSEKKFRQLFNNANEIFFLYSLDRELNPLRISEINQYGLQKLGYSKREIGEIDPMSIFAPDKLDELKEIFEEFRQEGQKRFDTIIVDKKGNRYIVDVNAKIFILEGKKYFFFIARDVTEKKHFEEQIKRIQNLESISIVAGGIAHDFNNILTALIGNITLAKLSTVEEDGLEFLMEAERITYKAKDLTQQLLVFSKKGTLIKKTEYINDMIQETSIFCLRGSNIKCDFTFDKDLWPVEIDETQINRVISNIVINAKQAMPGGGTITIDCKNITLLTGEIAGVNRGNYIKISIKDEGPGIPEENRDKIFTPFFTTKKEGNGLGLASCFSIVTKHKGIITMDSVIGSGTTFHIYLPAQTDGVVEERAERGREQVQVIEESRGDENVATILIMDDDEDILNIASRMLKSLGYKALNACSGEEAIEIYSEYMRSNRSIDLVIFDLTIPGGMGGKEAIDRLLTIDPEIKAIVSSGYSNDKVILNYKENGFSEVLIKPYTIDRLRDVINNILKEK